MSFKRKMSALIIASISATSLPSYAAPTNMADQIFRKTPAISAAALSLAATAGTLLTGITDWNHRPAAQILYETPTISARILSLVVAAEALLTGVIWYHRQEEKNNINDLHSLKRDIKNNKTITTSNYPRLSSRHSLIENNISQAHLPCVTSHYSQPGNFPTRQLTPAKNFSDCLDREIYAHQHKHSDATSNLLIASSFLAANTAIAALNIFMAPQQKNYRLYDSSISPLDRMYRDSPNTPRVIIIVGQIFHKTPAISATVLSLVAARGTLLTSLIWNDRKTEQCHINELHSLKSNVENNKTISTSNYTCLSSNYTCLSSSHSSIENNTSQAHLPCITSHYSQPGNFSTRQLIPSANFSDCLDREIKEHHHKHDATSNLLMVSCFSAANAAIAALNIFTALHRKKYAVAYRKHKYL